MAKTVHTGWREITPGACLECGFDDGWDCDGRGNVLCDCQACGDCGIKDAYGFHNPGCPQIDNGWRDCLDCKQTFFAGEGEPRETWCESCQAHNARIAEENRKEDEERARATNARFDRMAAMLRAAYPTRIPEEWTR